MKETERGSYETLTLFPRKRLTTLNDVVTDFNRSRFNLKLRNIFSLFLTDHSEWF